MLNVTTQTIDQLLPTARQFLEANQLAKAEKLYRRILAIQPHHIESINVLGMMAMQLRQLPAALPFLQQAALLSPTDPDVHNNLANVLKDMGRVDEAVVAYQKALALSPDSPVVHNNLGQTLHRLDRLDDARHHLERAIQLNPTLGTPHKNLGQLNYDQGRIDDALACYTRAVEADPSAADAHWNLSIMHLTKGDYEKGWKEYEWRWRCPEFRKDHRYLNHPQWNGQPFANKTLLLHAEQGFGDALQFARYIPLILARGGKVIVEIQPELQPLLATNFPDCQWFTTGEKLPPFDFQSPLMSLPRAFDTRLGTIPNTIPYLHPDPHLVAHWKNRIAQTKLGLRIGLSWAGRETHANDRNRSLSEGLLANLLQTPNTTFFSLQKSNRTPPQIPQPLIDYTPDLATFADTAALIANLDLVLTVDTAVAHLAGAMAKKVWLLLPYVPDWRWLLGRTDSPWYPTMRLYRQPAPQNWRPVMDRLQTDLYELSRGP